MSGQADRAASRRAVLASVGAAGAGLFAGCVENVNTQARADGDGGQVVVKGSSTVFPVSDTVAQRYMENHDVNVTVDPTGTGGGFKNHFCPGTAPVNGASRPITETEQENCAENDVEPIEFEIAGDALTVAVNNDADWLSGVCFTFAELSQIWRDGGADQWSDVRDGWPDEPIELYGPPPTSGTYDWFNEHVVGEEYNHTADHEQTEEDNIILRGIEDSPYTMGYFGYAYYAENEDRVTAVPVVAEEGGDCAEPSLENASDGTYPMSRPLYIYVDRGALDRDAVFEFVAFYLEASSTELIADIGYVPVDEQTRNENLATLLLERP